MCVLLCIELTVLMQGYCIAEKNIFVSESISYLLCAIFDALLYLIVINNYYNYYFMLLKFLIDFHH